MRKEGFNIGISKTGSGHYTVENSGHGGAGVAAGEPGKEVTSAILLSL